MPGFKVMCRALHRLCPAGAVVPAFALAALAFANLAHADCTSPAASVGAMKYASNYNTMVFCDGSNWISMAGGVSVTINNGSGVTGSGTSGQVTYWNGASTLTGDAAFTYSGGTLATTTVNATNLGGTLSTAAQPNVTSVGTLTGLTMGGNIAMGTHDITNGGTATFTNLAGTLTTAAQPNITSVGTLAGLTMGGNITADGYTVSATNLYANSVSGSTGTFGSMGVGNINFSGTISSTTAGGTVSATYGYFKYISATNLGELGVSMLASLTDVTTTGKVSGSVLAYNAGTSKWSALPIQQVMSTTTMVAGWPDAIVCNVTNPNYGLVLFTPTLMPYTPDGLYYYQNAYYSLGVKFNSSGTFNSVGGSLTTSDCNTSISTLYSLGKAFNFIGTSDASGGAQADRIVSGTAYVKALLDAGAQVSGALYVSGAILAGDADCGSTNVGAVRVNPATGRTQLCLDH